MRPAPHRAVKVLAKGAGMRTVLLLAGGLAALAALAMFGLSRAERRFHEGYLGRAEEVRRLAGDQPPGLVTEDDLRGLPEPAARMIRHAGAVGRPRVSAVRVVHGGTFKASPKGAWLPIRGEYLITTAKPSFQWYGTVRMAPGVSVVAFDSYFDGVGRMQVMAMGAFELVDAHDADTSVSAFGRCVAELILAPTFFLDRTMVTWTALGPDAARATVNDGHHTTEADLFVRPDGALDRVVVTRAFSRAKGQPATLEKFTGKASGERSVGGRLVPAHLDGSWNLAEGDLHYVSFELERVAYE